MRGLCVPKSQQLQRGPQVTGACNTVLPENRQHGKCARLLRSVRCRASVCSKPQASRMRYLRVRCQRDCKIRGQIPETRVCKYLNQRTVDLTVPQQIKSQGVTYWGQHSSGPATGKVCVYTRRSEQAAGVGLQTLQT